MLENNPKEHKTFARTEREQLREYFAKRASQAPIPDPLDATSLIEWEEYITEMHELEVQLRNAWEEL